MNDLAADILEILLEADPRMKITWEGEDSVLLDFTPQIGTSIVVPCHVENPVDRVNKAMMALAHRMAFCHHCPHMEAKCAVETMGIYGGLRIVLGLDGMRKLENRLLEAYPKSKINLVTPRLRP